MGNTQNARKPKPTSRQIRAELSRARLEAPLPESSQALLRVSRETLVDMANRATLRGLSGVYQALGYLAQQREMLVRIEKMRAEMKDKA